MPKEYPRQDEIARVTRSRKQTRAAYDAMSNWYELFADPFEKRCRDAGIRQLAVQRGETVLEIGYGTGQAIVTLAEHVGPTGTVHGIDLSQGMYAIAQRRVHDAGLSERVQLQVGDATKLPFEPRQFNAIFMCFVLELFDTPDIPTVLHECRRALRPGGRLCVVALSKRPVFMCRLYEWLHNRFPGVFDCRPIRIEQSLEEAGFHDIEITRCSLFGLPVDIALANG